MTAFALVEGTQYEIAEMFRVTPTAVSQIHLGKSWKGRD